VQFEITPPTRDAVTAWIKEAKLVDWNAAIADLGVRKVKGRSGPTAVIDEWPLSGSQVWTKKAQMWYPTLY
jgi:hypothetical protein